MKFKIIFEKEFELHLQSKDSIDWCTIYSPGGHHRAQFMLGICETNDGKYYCLDHLPNDYFDKLAQYINEGTKC